MSLPRISIFPLTPAGETNSPCAVVSIPVLMRFTECPVIVTGLPSPDVSNDVAEMEESAIVTVLSAVMLTAPERLVLPPPNTPNTVVSTNELTIRMSGNPVSVTDPALPPSNAVVWMLVPCRKMSPVNATAPALPLAKKALESMVAFVIGYRPCGSGEERVR
jgi:hypothetical protein